MHQNKDSGRRLPAGIDHGESQHQPSSSFPSSSLLIVSKVVGHSQSIDEMNETASSSRGVSKPGRPRGRKPSAKVPCDDCIARASEKNNGASIELCEKCLSTLHRPRKKPQEQANVRRVRRQSNAIIDTAL